MFLARPWQQGGRSAWDIQLEAKVKAMKTTSGLDKAEVAMTPEESELPVER